jgi:hypothetical protein
MFVNKFEVKSFASPDEVRTPSKTRVEIVRLQGMTFGRFNLAPGWRWTECLKPVMKTDLCELPHTGYAVSGRIVIRLKDGTQKTVKAGDAYTIPPGHEAWVEGNEPFVGVELMSAEQYAKP